MTSSFAAEFAEPAGSMWPSPLGWTGFGHWAHLAGAFACALLAIWTVQRRGRHQAAGPAGIGTPVIRALAASAVWSLFAAGAGPLSPATQLAESARNIAWLFATYRCFVHEGHHETMRPVRPMLAVLIGVELMQPALLLLAWHFPGAEPQALIVQVAVLLRLLVITGGLVLVHNLYVGAIGAQRPLRWTCGALALMWGYDLNYYTIAWLAGGFPPEMTAMRGAAEVAFVELLAIGAVRSRDAQKFSPSRAVAFQSLSVLLIGLYLILMVGAARSMAWFGHGAGNLVELVFVAGGAAVTIAFVPSKRLRGWLKVTVVKHFFQHRYDYRAEWLRFTDTIGRGGPDCAELGERVVKATADLADSQSGLLLTPPTSASEGVGLELAARWLWPDIEVPAEALSPAAATFFEAGGFVIDLDELRAGTDHGDERRVVPEWLLADTRAWALVPLLHFGRLAGVVVLGRPAYARKLDWEDFDLLRVVGRQLASYLAEEAGQRALLTAGRFEEFNRRMAFVLHDIKNLSSQLGLLARNAERHAENPAFRADMLVTLKSAATRLETLLARLSRYGGPGVVETLEPVDAGALLTRLAAGYPGAALQIDSEPGCEVLAVPAALDQVVRHLVQNALDAGAPGSPVILRALRVGREGVIEIIDHGTGMSPDFLRAALFEPFRSTKPDGFGIGAFEARELVQAMRGRLDVESREGIGSRFAVRLQLAEAARAPGATGLYQPERKVA